MAKDHRFQLLASITQDKLTGRRDFPFLGCEEERQKVYSLLQQTVEAGEGNSLLIIGPRGSGKSRAVKDALARLLSDEKQNFHTVKLNGFIHTDDKLALREIWRQLGKELEAGEDDEQSKNYADTLSRLLAVLSHPAELSEEHSGKVADSVIFVLDEFDLFATHARQTLLYNLFDIAQSRKAPIAVLGLTTKVNVVEMLEKRVKSRFSHRYVYMRPHESLAAFKATCQKALEMHKVELSGWEIDVLSQPNATPATSSASRKPAKRRKKTSTPTRPQAQHDTLEEFLTSWNDGMQLLLGNREVDHLITHIYHTSNSIPLTFSALSQSMNPHVPTIFDGSQIHPGPLRTISFLPPDSKLSLLPQLPTLALTLLICAARLDVILAADVCNLAMAYEEYIGLVSRAKITNASSSHSTSSWGAGDGGLAGKVWGREFAREAWGVLMELELLVPAVGAVGGRRRVGDAEMVKCDVALEEIGAACPDLERGLAKWCKEI